MLRSIAILVLALILYVRAFDSYDFDNKSRGVCFEDGPSEGDEKKLVCCPGWKRWTKLDPIQCKPICDNGCFNGLCVVPNDCHCYQRHHFLNPLGRCVTDCTKFSNGEPCFGGHCKDGKCECTEEGFEPSDDNTYCKPPCIGGCGEGGRCVDVGSCECNKGYRREPQFHQNQGRGVPLMTCVPDCGSGLRPCGHYGKCVAPNTCKCDDDEDVVMVNNKCVLKHSEEDS